MCISQLFPRVVVAELLSEVTNREVTNRNALSLCVFMYTVYSMYVHTYTVCTYVCISIPLNLRHIDCTIASSS